MLCYGGHNLLSTPGYEAENIVKCYVVTYLSCFCAYYMCMVESDKSITLLNWCFSTKGVALALSIIKCYFSSTLPVLNQLLKLVSL